LTIDGKINGRQVTITVDTGAAVSLVKTAVAKGFCVRPLSGNVVLRTVTGETANVQGEADIELQLGRITLRHTTLVADIEDDFILGMDLIRQHGFSVDNKLNILKFANQEFILSKNWAEKSVAGRAAKTVRISGNTERIVYGRPGRLHNNADALSRRPCPTNCSHCQKIDQRETTTTVRRVTFEPEQGWNATDFRQQQLEDDVLGFFLRRKEAGQSRPSWTEISTQGLVFKALWSQWDSLEVQQGLLHRRWESADGKQVKLQLMVPRNKVAQVLEEIHGGKSGGHLGVNKTINKARERFYWVNYCDDVKAWCRQCDKCAASKGPSTRSRGSMKQYNVGLPFERMAIDVAGPFPETERGNKYILVATDYFSKWPEVFAIPNQEATTIVEVLFNNVFSRFGVPLELHSDQGRNFESKLFQKLCDLLGINKTRTTPLHPQSDGMVERFNRTLEEHLSKVVDIHQKDWDQHIPSFLLAYRSAIHDTTGFTPARVLFGRELRLPCDLKFGTPNEEHVEINDYIDELKEKLLSIHDLTRKKIRLASDRMKARYDLKANSAGFHPGERVWLYNPQRKKGRSPKLAQEWEGPYTILSRLNDVVYRIQRNPRCKMKVVHLDRLKKYQGTQEADRDDQA